MNRAGVVMRNPGVLNNAFNLISVNTILSKCGFARFCSKNGFVLVAILVTSNIVCVGFCLVGQEIICRGFLCFISKFMLGLTFLCIYIVLADRSWLFGKHRFCVHDLHCSEHDSVQIVLVAG